MANGALYGIIGALGVTVVGGGLYIAKQGGAFGLSTAAVVAPAPTPASAPAPTPKPPVAAAPQPAPLPPLPPGLSVSQSEQFRLLVVDARHAITRGDFNSADRALSQAERIDPRSSEVIAARRDLREAQQRANRDDRRIDSLVADARTAIARRDWSTANRLLDQAAHTATDARSSIALPPADTKKPQSGLGNGSRKTPGFWASRGRPLPIIGKRGVQR